MGTYLLDSDKVMGCVDEVAGREILRFDRGERLAAGGGIDVEEADFRRELLGGMTSEYRFFGRVVVEGTSGLDVSTVGGEGMMMSRLSRSGVLRASSINSWALVMER